MAISLSYGSDIESTEDSKFWDYQVANNADLLALPNPTEGQIANVLNTTGALNPFTTTKLKGIWVYQSGNWVYASQDLQDKLVLVEAEVFSNDTDIANLQNEQVTQNNLITQNTDKINELDWVYYVTAFDVTPTLNTTIASGDVWDYTVNGTSVYRLVPNPYVPAQDVFYSSFDGTNLTSELASRS